MISAGAMVERVTLQRATLTTSAHTGDLTSVYPQVAVVAAEITTISSRELLRSAQPVGTISHRVKIRDPGSRPTLRWRIVWRTRVLMVVSVVEHTMGYELSCIEVDE